MPEQFANDAASTVASGLNNTTTPVTFTVTTGHGARFPAAGNFRLLVESEILLCTARSGDSLTCTRAQEGTTAASHANGVAVTHVLTKAAIETARLDFTPLGICEGRLTTESGVSVSTTDRTAQATLYFTPHNGNRVALYDGSNWKVHAFTEQSLALSDLTSGKNYDLFLYDNAGTPTLEMSAAWTNDTTRADALATQDGVKVKSGALTRRHVGTFRATGATTTEDSGGGSTTQVGGKRFLWNRFNQEPRPLAVIDTTNSWSYTTDTWRQANGAAGNKVEFVVGNEAHVEALAHGVVFLSTNLARAAKVGVGIDALTPSGIVQGGFLSIVSFDGLYAPIFGSFRGSVGTGYHALNWIEKGADGTSTFLGDNGGDGQQTGLVATIHN